MAQKRRIRELEEDRKILLYVVETLVGALGECPDSHVRDLVSLVQKKAPLEEIRIFLGHAGSSSDKSDEDTGTDTAVVVGKDLASAVSIQDARSDTDHECPTGLPPCSDGSNSCARLSIAYLIDSTASTESTKDPETHVERSIPDLSINSTSDVAGLVFRGIQRCDAKVADNSVS
ncbi:hypothetical protein BJX65DRAFT_313665 [Aspergillus insuetus]